MAYAHIKKSPDKYSLLIIDYRMPQINGLRLATKLIESNKNMNVIIMVNDHDEIECNYKLTLLKNRYQS
ncbi:MAG TPA: response regulator [Nitrososphaeraceae archaeon]